MTSVDTPSEDGGKFARIPTVRRPRQGLPNWALIGLAAVVGVGIFSVLASQREAAQRTDVLEPTSDNLIASPPPLRLSPAATRPPEPPRVGFIEPSVPPQPARIASVPAPVRAPSPPAPAYEAPPQEYLPHPVANEPQANASLSTADVEYLPVPALVLDRGVSRLSKSSESASSQSGRDAISSTLDTDDADTGTMLRPRAQTTGPMILPVGTMMPAILQTPVDTARGGPVTAIISQDVRGQDGSRVLVPKGSKLLGEYPAGANGAGKRVLINWTRLLLPNGDEVIISFPTTDKNGAAGVKGNLHTNTVGRIAGAVFQTALNTATLGLLNRASSDTIIIGSPPVVSSMGSGATSQRRITIDAGEKIQVLVTRPIDFYPQF